MEARHLILTAVAMATIFALGQCNPHGLRPPSCACNLQFGGHNPCCCSELIVRPPPPVRPPRAGPRLVCGTIPGAPILNPVGSTCYCDQITVQPAVAPRPPCDLCAAKILQRSSGVTTMADETQLSLPPPPCSCGRPHCSCCSCGTPGCGGGCGGGGDIDIQYEGYATGAIGAAPADAVSLSLAFNQQQRAQRVVREEALAFGFNQLPKDVPVYNKQLLRVQEERLANWQAPAVELVTSVGTASCRDVEDEARDALLRAEQRLLEEELNAEVALSAVQPSLADIGYRPTSDQGPILIPEYGCAGGEGLITLSPNAPSYPLPIAYPEGRVVTLPYGEDDTSYEDACDDDEDFSTEVVVGSSSSSFVSVAPVLPPVLPPVGVSGGYVDESSYSQGIVLPHQAPCGAQLIDRIPAIGCQDS